MLSNPEYNKKGPDVLIGAFGCFNIHYFLVGLDLPPFRAAPLEPVYLYPIHPCESVLLLDIPQPELGLVFGGTSGRAMFFPDTTA